MSASTIPSCTGDITAEQLSSWRDESLGAPESRHLEAHVATCPACRSRLEEYASISVTLHDQRAPVPDERLWRGVQARTAIRRQRARRVYTSGRLWKSLGAVAAAVLLVAGFAQLLSGFLGGRISPQPTPTLAPTGTPQPQPLAWQPAAQQLTSISLGGFFTTVNALADGNTAYACETPSEADTRFVVWVTHDRAGHWTRTSEIPFIQTAGLNGECALAIDASNATTLAVSVGWHIGREGTDLSSAAIFVTNDGGVTWRRLANSKPSIIEHLTSRQGVVYALRSTSSQPSQVTLGLWASNDDMRTWQSIDQGIAVPGEQADSFWLNPSTGEILAHVSSTAIGSPPMWDTTDGGQHWNALTVPEATGDFEVQSPSAGQPWHMCEMFFHSTAPRDDANQMWCSLDGGRNWLSRPTVNFTFTCLKCSGMPGTPTTEAYSMSLIGITSDNAVLATVEVPFAGSTPVVPAPPGAPQPTLTLYRLPMGSASWQSLGPIPVTQEGNSVLYISSPGSGVLWSLGDSSHLYTVAYP